jgi:hypothetical protein
MRRQFDVVEKNPNQLLDFDSTPRTSLAATSLGLRVEPARMIR